MDCERDEKKKKSLGLVHFFASRALLYGRHCFIARAADVTCSKSHGSSRIKSKRLPLSPPELTTSNGE